MAQPFACLCGRPSCKGTIAGAGQMSPTQLEGNWLSGHIRRLLEEKSTEEAKGGIGVASHALKNEMGGDTAMRA